MFKSLQAEHILAIIVAGIFVLVDVVVVWAFMLLMEHDPIPPKPVLPSSIYSIEQQVQVSAPAPTLNSRTLGGTTEEKIDAIRQLEAAMVNHLEK